jgi:hypothetical protein
MHEGNAFECGDGDEQDERKTPPPYFHRDTNYNDPDENAAPEMRERFERAGP